MLDELPANGPARSRRRDKTVRRALINAIVECTPTGSGRGQRSAREAREVREALGEKVAIDAASPEVLHALGIPAEWAERCKDSCLSRSEILVERISPMKPMWEIRPQSGQQ